MIMPFIRLISIYVVVILAVVAVFKRDQISELTGITLPWSQSETAAQAAAPPVASPATPPVTPPATPAQVADTQEADTQESAPPITAPTQQAAIQMPTPDPVPDDEVAVVTAPTAPQTPATPAPDTASRLNEARKTYWNGDVAGAQALYAALARDAPDNADVQGELGNILYAQRRYNEAADAYFITGKLLVEKGNTAQAMALINVLQSLAPDKAATLYAMMTN